MVSQNFIEELRLQFERYVQLKERLDTKANNIITMSGTVATLFMGFGTFLLQNIDFLKFQNLALISSILLIAEVVLTAGTIACAFLSYRLRTYEHPISYQAFYDPNTNEINPERIDPFNDADDESIRAVFVKNYLICIKSYEEQNNEQTAMIDISRLTFFASICIIPIFTFFVILTKFP